MSLIYANDTNIYPQIIPIDNKPLTSHELQPHPCPSPSADGEGFGVRKNYWLFLSKLHGNALF
jgi:hypothetical protein